MSRPLRVLLDGGAFFEGPRWHEGRWWVSDFYRRVVVAVDSRGRDEEVLTVDGQPSGLGRGLDRLALRLNDLTEQLAGQA